MAIAHGTEDEQPEETAEAQRGRWMRKQAVRTAALTARDSGGQQLVSPVPADVGERAEPPAGHAARI